MENIEFKAKRHDDSGWVCGYYCELAGRKYIIPDYSQFRDIHDADLENSFTEIIQETVCQWTGLLDKKGAKIFDGDIFQYSKHDGYLLPDFTGAVLFRMGSFGYVPTSENMREAFTSFSEIDELQEDFLDYIEVIGNIHDKAHQKQALIDMMRGDEEIGLYDDNPKKNHGYKR
jgi:uncharacterized phage protein (TIGR01671 family)